jgi:O-antigen/teichoic acid export membrane protein
MHPFLTLWIGAEIAAKMAPVAIILLLGIWINGPSYPCYAFLQAIGRPDIMTKFYLIQLIPFLIFLWLLIEWIGIYGAAIAWSLRMLADAIAWFVASDNLTEFARSISRTVPFVAGAVLITASNINFYFTIALSALIMTATVYVSIIMIPPPLGSKIKIISAIKTILNKR